VQLNYHQFLPEYGYSLRKLFCEMKVGELVHQWVNLGEYTQIKSELMLAESGSQRFSES
jgi:hypothetical protein